MKSFGIGVLGVGTLGVSVCAPTQRWSRGFKLSRYKAGALFLTLSAALPRLLLFESSALVLAETGFGTQSETL